MPDVNFCLLFAFYSLSEAKFLSSVCARAEIKPFMEILKPLWLPKHSTPPEAFAVKLQWALFERVCRGELPT